MKRTLVLMLALCLAVAVLAGCSGNPAENATPSLTPEERAQLYADAVTSARTEEDNEYNPVLSDPADIPGMAFEILGFTAEDAESLAVSVSLMNIKAYGIAVVKPADGKEEIVKAGLQGFIDMQRRNFEQYLPDQYEIAQNARLETLADGTVVMVMSPDQDTVYESIVSAVEHGAD
jgi:hypothetical protein